MELASGHGVRDVAGGGEIIVMGDEQQGRGMLAHCVPQHRKHLAAGLGVECSGRLVADEKLGLACWPYHNASSTFSSADR